MPLLSLLFKWYQNTDGVLMWQHRFCNREWEGQHRNTTETARWLDMKVWVFISDSLSVRRKLTYISKEAIKWKLAVVFYCLLWCSICMCRLCLCFSESLNPLNSSPVLRNNVKKNDSWLLVCCCCCRWKLSLLDKITNNSPMTNTFPSSYY